MKILVRMFLIVLLVGVIMNLGAIAASASTETATPTCSTTLGVVVHGQHIVGDYLTGTGVDWPPNGQVGDVIAGSGPAVPGGPGPGFHFPNGFAPGASFCNGSQSPGVHL